MFQFLTFTHQSGFAEDDQPDLPGLGQITCHEAYAQLQANLKAAFHAELLQEREGFSMAMDVAGMGSFSLSVQTFDQTAALVHVGLREGEPEVVELEGPEGEMLAAEVGRYMGSWILLSGLKAGDTALLAFLRQPIEHEESWKEGGQEGGLLLPENMVDMLVTIPKPIVMQRLEPVLNEITSSDGAQAKLYWFLIACEAFGQAFFDQLGLSRADEMPPETT